MQNVILRFMTFLTICLLNFQTITFANHGIGPHGEYIFEPNPDKYSRSPNFQLVFYENDGVQIRYPHGSYWLIRGNVQIPIRSELTFDDYIKMRAYVGKKGQDILVGGSRAHQSNPHIPNYPRTVPFVVDDVVYVLNAETGKVFELESFILPSFDMSGLKPFFVDNNRLVLKTIDRQQNSHSIVYHWYQSGNKFVYQEDALSVPFEQLIMRVKENGPGAESSLLYMAKGQGTLLDVSVNYFDPSEYRLLKTIQAPKELSLHGLQRVDPHFVPRTAPAAQSATHQSQPSVQTHQQQQPQTQSQKNSANNILTQLEQHEKSVQPDQIAEARKTFMELHLDEFLNLTDHSEMVKAMTLYNEVEMEQVAYIKLLDGTLKKSQNAVDFLHVLSEGLPRGQNKSLSDIYFSLLNHSVKKFFNLNPDSDDIIELLKKTPANPHITTPIVTEAKVRFPAESVLFDAFTSAKLCTKQLRNETQHLHEQSNPTKPLP